MATPGAPPALHAASVEPSVDLVLFLCAEQHGISPAHARTLVLDVLGRLASLGIDVPTAHAALSSLIGKRPAVSAALVPPVKTV